MVKIIMKKQRNLRKTLLLVLMFILMLGSTVATYAYWGGLISQSEESEQTITVGEGREATVSSSVADNLNENEVLVPTGQSVNSSNPNLAVESVTFTYTVQWNDNLDGLIDGSLTTVIDNVKIGANTTYANLVNFNITTTPTTINVNGTATITIVVTLTEPSTQAIYDAVKNQNITFDVTFTVVPN
jgi:hypothetical protein